MKTKKLFSCAYEELPVIGGFVVGSAKRDLADFSAYSPEYTQGCFTVIEEKIMACRMKVRSWTVIQELKATTDLLHSKPESLRGVLNRLEGYLKLADGRLDVPPASMGLSAVRKEIHRGNMEGLLEKIGEMMTPLRRNLPVLTSLGLTEDLLFDIEATAAEINRLNEAQNMMVGKRNQLTQENAELFNDLWLAIKPLFDTGKALYRGTNAAKLQDYTVAQLIKRIRHTGGGGPKDSPKA